MPYTYDYPRPAFTVDAIVFRKKEENYEVLLIKRKHDPFKGMWAFPGGFMDMDETAEHAVLRELREETGLTGVELRQLRTVSKVDRDPRGRTVSLVFYGFATPGQSGVEGADDASDAQWFAVNDLPPMAFDHDDIVNYAISYLKLLG